MTFSTLSRRNFLRTSAHGFGLLALGALSQDRLFAGEVAVDPLAAKKPHFPAKAKRVIFLFMGGGVSHVDTFDPKPKLAEYDGKEIPISLDGHLRQGGSKVFASPCATTFTLYPTKIPGTSRGPFFCLFSSSCLDVST